MYYKFEVHIVRKSYQGQHSLEGNQCSQFLKKLDTLELELMKEPSEIIVSTLPYLQTFRAFRGVQESCFGMEVKSDYEEKEARFSREYRALEISITPKVDFDHKQILMIMTQFLLQNSVFCILTYP